MKIKGIMIAKLKKISFIIILLVTALTTGVFAQSENKFLRKGNKEYEKQKHNDAEILYRKALEKNNNFAAAYYNLGNTYYRQNKFSESFEQYNNAIHKGLKQYDLAKAYHNMGNALLQAQKIQESIEAYKQALRINPKDKETKYNLALAQKLLKENQQNQNNQQNNQQNQQKENEQQSDNNAKNNDPQNEQTKNATPHENKMTKEQAKQLLEAIQNDENMTQEKLKKQQAQGKKYRPEKDW